MFAGREEEADSHYRRASKLDPEACPAPTRMSDDEAVALLDEVVKAMPESIRGALASVAIEVTSLPDVTTDKSPDLHPEMLGLYDGVPLTEKSVFESAIPQDRIRIFKHNLERFSGDRDALIRELRITLLHEVGHHLGWDEDDLAERGLA